MATPPAPIAAAANQKVLRPCPKCKQGFIRKTKMGAGCSQFKEGCTFTIWGEVCGKKLNEGHIRQLVMNGKTVLIRGFKKKDGSGTYDAKLKVSDEFTVALEF